MIRMDDKSSDGHNLDCLHADTCQEYNTTISMYKEGFTLEILETAEPETDETFKVK
jgi:hypothetical protein